MEKRWWNLEGFGQLRLTAINLKQKLGLLSIRYREPFIAVVVDEPAQQLDKKNHLYQSVISE